MWVARFLDGPMEWERYEFCLPFEEEPLPVLHFAPVGGTWVRVEFGNVLETWPNQVDYQLAVIETDGEGPVVAFYRYKPATSPSMVSDRQMEAV